MFVCRLSVLWCDYWSRFISCSQSSKISSRSETGITKRRNPGMEIEKKTTVIGVLDVAHGDILVLSKAFLDVTEKQIAEILSSLPLLIENFQIWWKRIFLSSRWAKIIDYGDGEEWITLIDPRWRACRRIVRSSAHSNSGRWNMLVCMNATSVCIATSTSRPPWNHRCCHFCMLLSCRRTRTNQRTRKLSTTRNSMATSPHAHYHCICPIESFRIYAINSRNSINCCRRWNWCERFGCAMMWFFWPSPTAQWYSSISIRSIARWKASRLIKPPWRRSIILPPRSPISTWMPRDFTWSMRRYRRSISSVSILQCVRFIRSFLSRMNRRVWSAKSYHLIRTTYLCDDGFISIMIMARWPFGGRCCQKESLPLVTWRKVISENLVSIVWPWYFHRRTRRRRARRRRKRRRKSSLFRRKHRIRFIVRRHPRAWSQ